jgi:hypothetical protein
MVTLTLDGVFFADGSFAGPNRYQLWEQVVSNADAHLEVARIAKQGHFEGRPPKDILADIEKLTGPGSDGAPVPRPGPGVSAEDYRRSAFQWVGWVVSETRKTHGDERAIYMLSDWAYAPVPKFRKL